MHGPEPAPRPCYTHSAILGLGKPISPYEAARVDLPPRQRDGGMAARGARATGDAGDRISFSGSQDTDQRRLSGVRQGLKEVGYIDGQRWL